MPFDAPSIRQLTDDEIREEIERAQEEIARLRYRAAFEDLENPSLLRSLRRDIARMKTIARERAAEADAGGTEEEASHG